MKTVNIYIETTIKAPTVKDGKYASALVFTKANGENAYRIVSGEECDSTYNRLTLIAMIRSSRGQAVLGRQLCLATPWLTERHGYDPT